MINAIVLKMLFFVFALSPHCQRSLQLLRIRILQVLPIFSRELRGQGRVCDTASTWLLTTGAHQSFYSLCFAYRYCSGQAPRPQYLERKDHEP